MSDPKILLVSETQKLHEIELEAFEHLGKAIESLTKEVQDLNERVKQLEKKEREAE